MSYVLPSRDTHDLLFTNVIDEKKVSETYIVTTMTRG